MLKQQLQFPLYHQTIHEALPDPDLAQYFLDRFPTPGRYITSRPKKKRS